MDRTRLRHLSTCAVLAVAVLLAAILRSESNAAVQRQCRPVSGPFVMQPADFDGDPNTLDFGGPMNGSIQGRFEARNLLLIGFPDNPATAEDGETPDVFLFTERLDLIAEMGFLGGTTLKTIGEGSFDVVSGLFTEILTVIDAVGEEDIAGQLFFFGDFDPIEEIGAGDYEGVSASTMNRAARNTHYTGGRDASAARRRTRPMSVHAPRSLAGVVIA